MCRDCSPFPVLQNQGGSEQYLWCDGVTRSAPDCADAPVKTAVSPYLCTSVWSKLIEVSLRSPELTAARIPDLSNLEPLSSVSAYESTRISSSVAVSAFRRASTHRCWSSKIGCTARSDLVSIIGFS